MAKRAWGVESIEFAPVDPNGALPTVGWEKVHNIENGSVTFNVPETAVTEVTVEDVDGAIDVLPNTEQEAVTLTLASVELEEEKVIKFIGGTFDVPSQTYNAPALSEIKHLAFRVTSRPHRGKKFQFFIRNGAIVSNVAANFTKGQLIALAFTVRSTIPTDGSGNPVSPWGWRIIDTTPTT
jgi:hypothetical protein